MDNCAGDNKKQYVFSILSLFIARGVLGIVEVGFLLMGHTHKDIDENYGRLSSKLMRKDIFSLPKAMYTYRICEDHNSYVPYLIYENFDFKKIVEPHLLDGNYKITDIKNVSFSNFILMMIFYLCNIILFFETKVVISYSYVAFLT